MPRALVCFGRRALACSEIRSRKAHSGRALQRERQRKRNLTRKSERVRERENERERESESERERAREGGREGGRRQLWILREADWDAQV